MKIFFYVLFQLTSTVCLCQNTIKNEADSIEALCNKWQLIKSTLNDTDPPFSPDGSQSITYKRDGSFLMIAQGQTINGKWKLDINKRLIITNDNELNLKWKIVKLTLTELN